MRKSLLFAVAGAGVILAGCNAGNHRHTMIPVDDPYQKEVVSQPKQAPGKSVETPEVTEPKVKKQTTAKQFKYEPMTDAVSSGGVDSAPRKGSKGAKTAQAGKTAAPGGTYIVQRGDTLDRIARKHKVRLAALMSANKLDDASARRLQVGKKLTIPAGNEAVVKSSGKKSSAVSKENTGKTESLEKGKYRVARGDTPERIARKHKVKLRELLAANNLNDDSARRLQIGQVLVIPGSGAAASPAPAPAVKKTPAATAETAPAVKTDKAEKTVDTAAKKAEPAGETTADDASKNSLWEATEDYTYAAAAAKFNVSEAKLREANSASATDTISKGSLIIIPQK